VITTPPPVVTPPAPPPAGAGKIIRLPIWFGAPGTGLGRIYTGVGPVSAFGGNDILAISFTTPAAPDPDMVLGVSHTADGSHLRRYILSAREEFDQGAPGVMWRNDADAISLRFSVGVPTSGRINLECGRTYYVTVNNNPPGEPVEPGPHNVVVTYTNP
jgi:hypothetical protein